MTLIEAVIDYLQPASNEFTVQVCTYSYNNLFSTLSTVQYMNHAAGPVGSREGGPRGVCRVVA